MIIWNSLDAIQITRGLRIYTGVVLMVVYSANAYGVISLRGHTQVMVSHEIASWWKMEISLLDHELSALTTMVLFVTKDVVLSIRRPRLCKALIRKVEREWISQADKKSGLALAVAARFKDAASHKTESRIKRSLRRAFSSRHQLLAGARRIFRRRRGSDERERQQGRVSSV